MMRPMMLEFPGDPASDTLDRQYMLGDALYEAYLKGRVSRSMLRRLFLVHLEEPGVAKEMFREIAAKVRCNAKKLPGSVTR